MPSARTLAASPLSPRHDEDRRRAGGAHLAGDREPVRAGHRQVEQDEVRALLAEAPDGGQAVVGRDDLVALGADERGDGADHRRVVVDDEDAEGRRLAITAARPIRRPPRPAGRRRSAPRPARPARTTGGAPIDSTSRLAAYSPIPEPRAVCVSRRAYGSKIRSRHSSGMPGPSSETPQQDDALVERPVDRDRASRAARTSPRSRRGAR